MNSFLIGAYDKNITEVQAHKNQLETVKLFSGHSKSVRSVNLSHDENYIVSSCDDSSLRVWDFNSQKAQYILSGHQ